jgi:D-alanine-D-alanine ligase
MADFAGPKVTEQARSLMAERYKVLLVGDVLDESRLPSVRSPFEQDMPSTKEVADIVTWLTNGGYDVEVETSVSTFVNAGKRHSQEIVFPLWRAGPSRNRTAIVPAVCEALALPYVGGDALVQAVCQDKSLSKALVRAAGLRVPGELVIRSVDEVAGIQPTKTLVPPFVVKPLYSACSIGIDASSMCASDEQARSKACDLFRIGLGPVICEEFVSGDEVSLCILEDHGTIAEKCVAVYRDEAGMCPFHDSLLTFEAKTQANPGWAVAEHSRSIDATVWEAAGRMLKAMGKVDLLRIDGRLRDGKFTVIELTPDIHLGIESLFLGGFDAIGKNPTDVLDSLIRISLANQGWSR